MSQSVENQEKKKCSNCQHYQMVAMSGNRQTMQCINPDVFKEDAGATNVGYINANVARRFSKYCSSDATYFLAVPQAETEDQDKKKSFILRYLFGSDKEDIVISSITKSLVVIVLTVTIASIAQII